MWVVILQSLVQNYRFLKMLLLGILFTELSIPSGLASLEWEKVGGWNRSQGCRGRRWHGGTLPFKYHMNQNGHAVTISHKQQVGLPTEQFLKGLSVLLESSILAPWFNITEIIYFLLPSSECSPSSHMPNSQTMAAWSIPWKCDCGEHGGLPRHPHTQALLPRERGTGLWDVSTSGLSEVSQMPWLLW